MRTVDPEKWYKKFQKNSIHLRFGQKHADGVETRLRESFRDAAHEYWRNCSVKGVRHTIDTRLSKFERWSRGVVVAAALCVCVQAVWGRRRPAAQVAPQPARRRIQLVPFPAVALCSAGVVSQRRLRHFTSSLALRDQNHTYSWSSIQRNLLTFGSLLTMTLPEIDVNFIPFLTLTDGSAQLNVSNLMYQLSLPCEDTLKRCSWRGKLVPCERLFATRVTPLGFCCVFNSRYYAIDLHRSPKYLDMVGRDFGLSVVIQENPDDFARIRRASIGLDVLLFDGSEYPILEGGGVRMIPVEPNASVSVSVRAREQAPGAASACRRRGYASCLARCRRRTAAALCACRHYTLPADGAHAHPVCSLSHLSCLNKHKEKLLYYYPEGASDPALVEELENGQVCEECAPDCARLLYSAAGSRAPHDHTRARNNNRNTLMKGLSYVNSTVIHLFYSSKHQEFYVIEASELWFETFAIIGSYWAGTVGLTAAAGAELVFHLTVRCARHYRRRARRATPTTRAPF